MFQAIRLGLKWLLAPILYRYPPIGLSPNRLYTYLDTLHQTALLPGAVVEVGCNQCGTTAVASRFLKQLGLQKEYVAIDTFQGFPASQRQDLGPRYLNSFTVNSIHLAQRILSMHKGRARLVEADIVTFDELPQQICVALIDVDLYVPTTAALEKLYPRLVPGGILLVDDCPPDENYWPARKAYLDFMQRMGREPEVLRTMGVVRKPSLLVENKSS